MFPMPTLGGLQLYWDRQIGRDWRLQEAAFAHPLGRFRLINHYGLQFAQGDKETCCAAIPSDQNIEASDTIIFLHGLARTRHSFWKMARRFRKAGYMTVSVSYASTRGTTVDHAARLVELLQHLPKAGRLYFVCHSFGSLILRQALSDPEVQDIHHRFCAAALLGPPNQGSIFGQRLSRYGWFKLILGKGGQSVLPAAVESLPGLDIRFMLVAGTRGNNKGWNPIIPGDDDGIVGLNEVHLPGSDALFLSGYSHSFLMDDPKVSAEIQRYFNLKRKINY